MGSNVVKPVPFLPSPMGGESLYIKWKFILGFAILYNLNQKPDFVFVEESTSNSKSWIVLVGLSHNLLRVFPILAVHKTLLYLGSFNLSRMRRKQLYQRRVSILQYGFKLY